MKQTLTKTILLGGLVLLAGVPAQAQNFASAIDGENLVPLAELEADGARVPEAARSFLDAGFFTRDLTPSFENGRNFTASLALPASALHRSTDLGLGLVHQREGAGLDLRIYLTNLADAPNDVALSAVRHGALDARNALVRVEPGETLGIAADGLAGYDEIRLLSIQDFEARAVLGGSAGKAADLRLETTAPSVARNQPGSASYEKSINYCQSVSNTIVEISGSGGGVLACAQRTAGSGTHYEYAIDYPTCGDPFHCKTSGGSVFTNPPCQMYSNTTRRCSDSSIEHNWQNLDLVVFSCGTGAGQCVRGCTGSFTVTCP